MEAAPTLVILAEQSLLIALATGGEQANGLIPVENTPFVLSRTTDTLLVHGFLDHEGTRYYIGVPESNN